MSPTPGLKSPTSTITSPPSSHGLGNILSVVQRWKSPTAMSFWKNSMMAMTPPPTPTLVVESPPNKEMSTEMEEVIVKGEENFVPKIVHVESLAALEVGMVEEKKKKSPPARGVVSILPAFFHSVTAFTYKPKVKTEEIIEVKSPTVDVEVREVEVLIPMEIEVDCTTPCDLETMVESKVPLPERVTFLHGKTDVELKVVKASEEPQAEAINADVSIYTKDDANANGGLMEQDQTDDPDTTLTLIEEEELPPSTTTTVSCKIVELPKKAPVMSIEEELDLSMFHDATSNESYIKDNDSFHSCMGTPPPAKTEDEDESNFGKSQFETYLVEKRGSKRRKLSGNSIQVVEVDVNPNKSSPPTVPLADKKQEEEESEFLPVPVLVGGDESCLDETLKSSVSSSEPSSDSNHHHYIDLTMSDDSSDGYLTNNQVPDASSSTPCVDLTLSSEDSCDPQFSDERRRCSSVSSSDSSDLFQPVSIVSMEAILRRGRGSYQRTYRFFEPKHSFPCDVCCFKMFSTEIERFEHLYEKANRSSWECEMCEASFNRPMELHRHKLSNHKSRHQQPKIRRIVELRRQRY